MATESSLDHSDLSPSYQLIGRWFNRKIALISSAQINDLRQSINIPPEGYSIPLDTRQQGIEDMLNPFFSEDQRHTAGDKLRGKSDDLTPKERQVLWEGIHYWIEIAANTFSTENRVELIQQTRTVIDMAEAVWLDPAVVWSETSAQLVANLTARTQERQQNRFATPDDKEDATKTIEFLNDIASKIPPPSPETK